MVTVILLGHQLFHGDDDVLHGAYRLELLGSDSLLSHLLQAHDEIDRVDAVKIQVFVQPGIRTNLLGVEVEKRAELAPYLLVDLICTYHGEVTRRLKR